MESNVEQPFIFNCWKHHKNFVKSKIEFYSLAGVNMLSELRNEIKVIGESQTDFYLGDLSPARICSEIKTILKSNGNFEYEDYINLLNQNQQFHIIKLSDNSLWTLRLGAEGRNYIHFHPGRSSSKVIRINSATLKSAVSDIIFSRIIGTEVFDLFSINESRKIIPCLPPLKNIRKGSNLLKTISLLLN